MSLGAKLKVLASWLLLDAPEENLVLVWPSFQGQPVFLVTLSPQPLLPLSCCFFLF